MFQIEKFRPTSRRRRVLIVLMALVMGVAVMWSMTRKWGLVRSVLQHPADVAACTDGQTSGCVGSKTQVLALPPPAPAAAASR